MFSLNFANNGSVAREFIPNLSKVKIENQNHFDLEIKNLTQMLAKTFELDRVGVWFIDKSKSICKSKNFFELKTNTHSDNKFLAISTFPEYLKLLHENKIILSTNASRDSSLGDFWERYLKDLNIYSFLNSTIWINGEMVGFVTFSIQNKYKEFSEDEIYAASNAADAISNWTYQLSNLKKAEPDQTQIAFKELIKKFIYTCSQITFMSSNDCISQILDTAKRVSKAESISTYILEDGKVNFFSTNKNIKAQGTYKIILDSYRILQTSKFLWIPDPKKPLIGIPKSFFDLLDGLSGPCLISTIGIKKTKTNPSNIGIAIYHFETFDSEFNKDFLELATYTGEALKVISEFSKTTSLFKESLEISRAAFQNSSVGMIILNKEGGILRANPAAKNILGFCSSRTSSTKITSFFTDEKIRNKLIENLNSVDGKTFQTEAKLTNSAKKIKAVILNLSPIIIHQENRSFSILQLIDVTKRHKAIKQLAFQKEFFRTVIDASPNFVFAKDRAGTFILANKAVANAYGTSIEELVGKKDSDYNSNIEQVNKFLNDDKYVLDTDQELIIHDEVVTDSTGTERVLYTVKKALYFGSKKSKLVLGVSTDITSRRKAELEYKEWYQKIEQTQKLESLGLLASGIAHDFNNILQGVIGNSSLASELVAENSPAKNLILKTLDSAEKAAEITSQLLSYSGKAHQELSYQDLTEIVKETSKLVERMSIKKARLVYNVTTTPLPILADLPKLRQVILNLITNAIESIEHKNGEILIKTFTIFPTNEESTMYAALQVK
jgi:PAS domain S-box-containing protein